MQNDAFEKWAVDIKGFNIEQLPDGRYRFIDDVFVGWQASASRILAGADEVVETMLLALEVLHDDNFEYLTINNLGGKDNRGMVLAREAIAKAQTWQEMDRV